MKKLYLVSLAALGMMLGGCANELDAPASATNDGMLTITAQLPPELASRAYSQGTSATTLSYAVYEAGTKNVIFTSEEPEHPQASLADELSFTLSLNLVKGQTYDFVFWADAEGAPYTFAPADQTISIDYDALTGNDDLRDAFFNAEKGLLITGAMQKNIKLRRPFAQLNIGTDDKDVAAAAKVNHKYTTVTVQNVYSTLNLMSGIASDATEVTFPLHETTGETFPVAHADANRSYEYISMNYVLTGSVIPDKNINEAQKETKDLTISLADENKTEINAIKLSAVPFQRNYRTNIYGSLLTSQVDFAIDVVPAFWEEPGHPYEVATPEEVMDAITHGGSVVMTQDMEMTIPASGLTISPTEPVNIQVGSHKLTVTGTLFATEGSQLTISGDGENGQLIAPLTDNLIEVKGGAEVNLEGLYIGYDQPKKKSVLALLTIAEKGSKTTIKNCVLEAEVYAIATNATNPDQDGVLEMENVHFVQKGEVGTPFHINVPLTVNAKNCQFEGALHAAFLRGGTHTFTDCTFTLTLDLDSEGNCICTRDDVANYRSVLQLRTTKWRTGNTAPISAVLMGNNDPTDTVHYQYPTTVTMTGCTLNIPEVAKETAEYGRAYTLPAVYAFANPEEGKGVTFTYDETTVFNGAQDYASPNIVVNGVELQNCTD